MYFLPAVDLTSGVLVCGGKHRNRATHGDVVAVELLPKSEWRGKVTALSEGQPEERSSEGGGTMPTGETLSSIPVFFFCICFFLLRLFSLLLLWFALSGQHIDTQWFVNSLQILGLLPLEGDIESLC